MLPRSTRSATNLTLQSVDYARFKKGTQLNSTEADTPELGRGRLPSYMTPTMAAQNRMFKTPTTPSSRYTVRKKHRKGTVSQYLV